MTPRAHMALLAGLLAALSAAPAFAQQPPPGEPPPPTREDRKRNNAAKLGGLVAFVKASCPEAKADESALASVVTRLGIDPADLGQGELLLRVKAYVEIYQKDVPANCARALENFGEGGKTLPGLISKR